MKIIRQVIVATVAEACERGWTQDPMGNCLKISQVPRTWHEAQSDCMRQQGHILRIEDQSYNEMVTYMSPDMDMWIGYESPKNTVSFFDSTGRSAVYSNWSDATNSRPSSANCAFMAAYSEGQWKHQSCTEKLPYVCQKTQRIIGNELTDATFEALMTCHDWINQALTCRKPFEKISKYEFRFTKVAKDALWHVLAVKNCNWPEAEDAADRYRRGARRNQKMSMITYPENALFDKKFSLSFDDMYISYLLSHGLNIQNGRANFTRIAQIKLSGEGSGTVSDYETDDDRALARLAERQSKKVEAHLSKAEKMCRTSMDKVWEREEFLQCPKLGSWKRRMTGLQDVVSKMMYICLKREKFY